MEYSNNSSLQTAATVNEAVAADVPLQPERRQLSERARDALSFGAVFLFSAGLVSGFAVTAKAALTAWLG